MGKAWSLSGLAYAEWIWHGGTDWKRVRTIRRGHPWCIYSSSSWQKANESMQTNQKVEFPCVKQPSHYTATQLTLSYSLTEPQVGQQKKEYHARLSFVFKHHHTNASHVHTPQGYTWLSAYIFINANRSTLCFAWRVLLRIVYAARRQHDAVYNYCFGVL